MYVTGASADNAAEELADGLAVVMQPVSLWINCRAFAKDALVLEPPKLLR